MSLIDMSNKITHNDMLRAAKMILEDFTKTISSIEMSDTYISSTKYYAPFPESTLVRYKNNRIPDFPVCCENMIKRELGATYCHVHFSFDEPAIKVTVAISYNRVSC